MYRYSVNQVKQIPFDKSFTKSFCLQNKITLNALSPRLSLSACLSLSVCLSLYVCVREMVESEGERDKVTKQCFTYLLEQTQTRDYAENYAVCIVLYRINQRFLTVVMGATMYVCPCFWKKIK